MSAAGEELAGDQETFERFALAETINAWLDGEGLDIEMEFPIFPLAVAIIAAGWQSPARVEASLKEQHQAQGAAVEYVEMIRERLCEVLTIEPDEDGNYPSARSLAEQLIERRPLRVIDLDAINAAWDDGFNDGHFAGRSGESFVVAFKKYKAARTYTQEGKS